jgi:RNA polymerase sigma-70 factor (ECF subfamily)
MAGESRSADPRVERLRRGDRSVLAELLDEEREGLRRWIERRLDRGLQARVSASDVIQNVYLAAERRVEHFGGLDDLPFGVWVRLLAGQRLIESRRRHLDAAGRDARREISLAPGDDSGRAAISLPGDATSPSQAAIRNERDVLLEEALGGLDAIDREVIGLRHTEGLANGEVAERLGLSKSAATKRYVRALGRLRDRLGVHRSSGPIDGASS